MLTSLTVKNLALIRSAELEFRPGLNILSGETGAGKSILLGSVSLCLGGRAEKDMIRNGETYAYTELVFEEDDPGILAKLSEKDICPDEGRFIISRRISDGKNSAKINGETVTLSVLKEAAELLIDIHGQHDNQSLLHEEHHLAVLDGFAKSELQDALSRYGVCYQTYRRLREAFNACDGDAAERARRLDFLEFEIDEIENAKIVPGEEARLTEELKRLSNARAIRNGLTEIVSVLSEDTAEGLSHALKTANTLTAMDPALGNLAVALGDIEGFLQDTLKEARTHLEADVPDEDRLPAVEERLQLIAALKRKYGASETEILKRLEEFEKEYDTLTAFEENRGKLEAELTEAKKTLIAASKKLHEIRRSAADRFSAAMMQALSELNFLQATFETEVTETKRYTVSGSDDVRFLISTNPGEPLKPLSKVASGGELSRIMLAIKTLIADSDRIHTLIFDEIDAGISGKTGAAVAEKLHEIAKTRQVICISHLPQIVAMADHHFLIEKGVSGGNTETKISALSEADSAKELARLLSAGELTETALQNAYEMKRKLKGQTDSNEHPE